MIEQGRGPESLKAVTATETLRPRARRGPVVAYMPARGIGDVVWHLPAVRRLAGLTPEGQVIFLTRPTTRAAELLRHDPAIASVAYVPFQGKKHKLREITVLTRALRALKPRAVWILDQTAQPAFAAWLAGVPERRGCGEGRLLQIAMLSPGPALPRGPTHRIDKLRDYMDLWGAPPESPGPLLIVGAAERAAVRARFEGLQRPWIVVGLTASREAKIWPAERFAALVDRVAPGGTAFFVGGPGDGAVAQAAQGAVTAARGVALCDLNLGDLMALCETADAFVGNDSGPLNVAAGVGTPCLGLFGPTPVLDYSPNMTCIAAPDGIMSSIGVDQVASTLASKILKGRPV